MYKNKYFLFWFFLGLLFFFNIAGDSVFSIASADPCGGPEDPACDDDTDPPDPSETPPGPDSTSLGGEYILLEKIPGTDTFSGSDLPKYVSAIYKVALIIVTLSAVLMLSIGGFMYLTSAGNTASIGTAKGIITDSLIGLVIALSAWLVLYIINPDLVKISLDGAPLADVGPPPSQGFPPSALPTRSDQELATRILANNRITLLSDGDCKTSAGFVHPRGNIRSISEGKRADVCTPGCIPTEVGCMQEGTKISNKMLNAIATVGETQSFTINSISGGPHAVNSKHYTGQSIDISRPVNSPAAQALMNAFVAAGAIAPNGTTGTSMCEKRIVIPATPTTSRKVEIRSVDCTTGGSNHIHLVFSN